MNTNNPKQLTEQELQAIYDAEDEAGGALAYNPNKAKQNPRPKPDETRTNSN